MATIAHLVIEKGTTRCFGLNFQKTGVTTSIEGWSIYFTVKEDMEDADSSALIKKTITDHYNEDAGETLIELSISDTDLIPGTYYYSIDFKDDSDNENVLFKGQFIVVDTVLDSRS